MTRLRDGPGTSMPCQKPMVAKSEVASSSLKAEMSAGLGRSFWVRIFQGSRGRKASAAAFMAR